MNTVDLGEYIFEGKSHFTKSFLHVLKSSSRFEGFVECYRDKIRKKIRATNYDNDTVKDVLAEIEWAYLLLQVDRFSRVEYESYGTKEQNPDLTVTDVQSGFVFNIESKRIRCTDLEWRFEAWKQRLARQVIAIPSKLAFSMDIDSFDTAAELVDRLEAKTEDVVSYITETVIALTDEIPPGSEKSYFVPGFEGVFEFKLRTPPRKASSDYTSYYGGSFPIFYTHKEYMKFGDEICDPKHLGQMRPDMVNILAISTDSNTHDSLDLGEAVANLAELAAQHSDDFFVKKGFEGGSADFAIQLERLSGILFRSLWGPIDRAPNILWCNNKAKCLIPKDIGSILQVMDYPESTNPFKAF
ncbi:MAG: hypothetical protein HOC09_05065 [Deltaproteobacteria bacterium]|jgi:hypothetical protein|nr:hypothetical protein [Deltaproteobacteria bacterium]